MKAYSNLQIAELFRKMAAAYQILNENRFKIIAYERAADSIEHLTSDIKDLWDDKKLSEIPGVGTTIVGHLDELFRTGSIKHIDSVLAKIPESVFPLLLVPGLGPKRAYKLVEELHLKNKKTAIEELEKALRDHKVASIEGFGEKSENDILQNIATFKKGAIKEKRILLSEADQIAENLISFLKKNNSIERIDILGSLRRFVATIGDIDIAIISKDPEKAISYFCTYPHVKIIEQGPTGASLLLHNGRQVDLRVQEKRSYGAMLQYFTGSKNHNIALRSYALTKHLSLSEYGIKDMSRQLASRRSGSSAISHQKKEGVKQFDNEKAFYEYLGMQYVPPELREDRGEIEHAINHTLPTLVEVSDIKGDFHIHTNYNLEPSHDLGLHSLEEILDEADALGYEYIGISDHNPSIGNHNDSEIISIMKKRHEYYKKHAEEWNTRHHKNIYVFTMLEVDIKPDGTLALPEEAFAYVDAVIASIHSSFAMTKEDMTVRIIRGISSHPKVRILGHPTGRLLNRREGFEVDWKKIFDVAKKKDIALEINASPYRLDLPDALVYDAVKFGCRLTIDSDAHQKEDMNMMKYGVSVGRRGWAEKRDICNTYSYNEMKKWLMPK
jgi:DNA polymerase (family 10)